MYTETQSNNQTVQKRVSVLMHFILPLTQIFFDCRECLMPTQSRIRLQKRSAIM